MLQCRIAVVIAQNCLPGFESDMTTHEEHLLQHLAGHNSKHCPKISIPKLDDSPQILQSSSEVSSSVYSYSRIGRFLFCSSGGRSPSDSEYALLCDAAHSSSAAGDVSVVRLSGLFCINAPLTCFTGSAAPIDAMLMPVKRKHVNPLACARAHMPQHTCLPRYTLAITH